jgi:hypothetical protein
MGKFIGMFLLVTVVNVAGAILSSRAILDQDVPVSYWITLSFIAVLTLIVHRILIGANNKRPQLFVTYFMGALTVKLFFSAMVLVAVGLIAKDQLAFTAVAYLIAYVLYTTIEIADLLPRMRNS